MPAGGKGYARRERPYPFAGLGHVGLIARPAGLALLGGENQADCVFHAVPSHLFQGLGNIGMPVPHPDIHRQG